MTTIKETNIKIKEQFTELFYFPVHKIIDYNLSYKFRDNLNMSIFQHIHMQTTIQLGAQIKQNLK